MSLRNYSFVVALCLAALLPIEGAAQVPVSMKHQGRLLNDSGEPMTGDVHLTFTIYASKTGDTILWQGQREVTLDDSGFYTTRIGGKDNPIKRSVLVGGQEKERWLGIQVDERDELTPRFKLDAVPYARVADTAESVAPGAVDSEGLASGAVDSDALDSNISISGENIDSLPWSNLSDVPSDLADGDQDKLGDLNCSTDEMARWDGSQWICSSTSDAKADWSNVQNKPSGFADDTDDDTLGGLSCPSGSVAEFDGTNWTCTSSDSAWSDVQNKPSGFADDTDNDVLGGLSCASGSVAEFDGTNWTCTSSNPDWSDVQNKPSGFADDTDNDVLGGLSCASGEHARWNGSNWECTAEYTDADAVSAVDSADNYVKNTGDTVDGNLTVKGNVSAQGASMNGNQISNVAAPTNSNDAATKQYVDRASQDRNLNSHAIKNVDWANSSSPHAWAALDLDNGKYFTSGGDTDDGLAIPSAGNTSCTLNGKACIRNVSGNFFQIGLRQPPNARTISWGGASNKFCWPVALGDQDPATGGSSWDSGVDVHSTDNAGSNMGHCVDGAPDNNYRIGCIKTLGTDSDSDTHYGIVCMK